MVQELIPQSSGPDRVDGAIRKAAAATGASFDYLLATAKRESALDPEARAKDSSATGLFQFIDSTWLQMVKEAGPSLGLSDAAAAIERTDDGRFVAADPRIARGHPGFAKGPGGQRHDGRRLHRRRTAPG